MTKARPAIKQKHQPQRTCIGCREVKSKRELIRVVRTPEGKVIVDPTGKANGRGAYLCKNDSCWQRSLSKGQLARVLKLTLSQEEIAMLESLLKAELSKI
jgi:predicted RNA-binding protein YlxR (DUF448 family)